MFRYELKDIIIQGLIKVFRTRKVWLSRQLFEASFRLVKPFSFKSLKFNFNLMIFTCFEIYVSSKLEVLSAKLDSNGTTDVRWIV